MVLTSLTPGPQGAEGWGGLAAPGQHTYNMAPGLWSTAPPAGRKFYARRGPGGVSPGGCQALGVGEGRVGSLTLVELGCRACSWYTVRQSLLRLM